MTARTRRLTVLALGAASVLAVVVAAVVLLDARRGERLQPSPTCEEADAVGGTRFRSPLPPDAPEPPPDGTGGGDDEGAEGATPAFRAPTAEAIYCRDFADPFVLRTDAPVGSRLYAYATNTSDALVPVLASGSTLRAEEVGDALDGLPPWAELGAIWAPSVLDRAGDGFVMHYTTTHGESGLQCLSVAVADDPLGPFVDRSTEPLVCPTELGGAIDPSLFVADDGTVHLLWKNDGNCCGIPSRIWSQPLDDTATALAGDPVELITADQAWEGGLVEGPSMVHHEGVHILFYSANAWDSPDYAIGYAVCDGPAGPCGKPDDHPWLASSQEAQGPGGQELFTDADDELQMVFHAWLDQVGYEAGGRRSLFTVGVEIRDGRPVPV